MTILTVGYYRDYFFIQNVRAKKIQLQIGWCQKDFVNFNKCNLHTYRDITFKTKFKKFNSIEKSSLINNKSTTY